MKNRRRRYVTDRSYQWGITLKILLVCLLGMLLNLVLFNYLAYRKAEALRWKMYLPVETTGEIVLPYLLAGVVPMVVTIAALYLLIRHSLIKTSGPVHRIRKDIENIAAGDLSADMYLRRGDFFRDIVNDCNRLISAMRSRFHAIKSGFSVIEKSLEKLEYVKEKPGMADAECRLMIEQIESIKRELEKVRNSGE